MSLRTKLIATFIAASLGLLILFAAVAYKSAHDYHHGNELERLHNNNLHLINMLTPQPPTLKDIQSMAVLHEGFNEHYLLINTQNREIISLSKADMHDPSQSSRIDSIKENLATEFFTLGNRRDNNTGMSSNGSFETGSTEYLWAADAIAGTPYTLAHSFQRAHNDFSSFLKNITIPLVVTILIGALMSLWASTILANLFIRITSQKKQMKYQSQHDALTSLPNRARIGELLDKKINAAKDQQQPVACCLVHLHDIKDINDSLGYKSGDQLLLQVRDRLQETINSDGEIGRFGGIKFALILYGHDYLDPIELGNKLINTFEPTFEINGQNLYIRVTLGLALSPEHANDAQSLIQKAEIALHQARTSDNDFAVYDTHQDRGSAERLELANDLRNAIRDNQLQLYFQPKLDLNLSLITGIEALARWTHPIHGFIPPDTFIEIAEQTGLIKPLTEWALSTAIAQCAEWNQLGKYLNVSINLSARNLHDINLVDQIDTLLRQHKVAADQITLEITETAMMADPEQAMSLLKSLDKLGVRISIDDFGTGYSSLSYIKQLPVDEIKIDKSFILNMDHDENDASIVKATVSLAHDLGLSVVAEGVETQQTLEQLQQLGCGYVQGYYICRPMPSQDLLPVITACQTGNEVIIQTAEMAWAKHSA